MKDEYRTTRFAGFEDGLAGAKNHMSENLDKALTLADNIYASQGNDAVAAITGGDEKEAAREMAENIVITELDLDEPKDGVTEEPAAEEIEEVEEPAEVVTEGE